MAMEKPALFRLAPFASQMRCESVAQAERGRTRAHAFAPSMLPLIYFKLCNWYACFGTCAVQVNLYIFRTAMNCYCTSYGCRTWYWEAIFAIVALTSFLEVPNSCQPCQNACLIDWAADNESDSMARRHALGQRSAHYLLATSNAL